MPVWLPYVLACLAGGSILACVLLLWTTRSRADINYGPDDSVHHLIRDPRRRAAQERIDGGVW
jgi:hypothetical protein